MHDQPSGLTPSMADQLLRLRTLRADHAQQAANTATRHRHIARNAEAEAAEALDTHRQYWRAEQHRHAERMRATPLSNLALRQTQDRLDALADQAITLQDALTHATTTTRTAEAHAQTAIKQAAEAGRHRDQAQNLRTAALAAQDAARQSAEDAELEDLVLMRHRPLSDTTPERP